MKTRTLFVSGLFVLLMVVSASAGAGSSRASNNLPPVPLPVWQSEVVAPGVDLTDQGVHGMALDPDGQPHVVYGRNRLFHAWYDGAAWQVEMVDAIGGSRSGPAIAIDDVGTITIVAYPDRSLLQELVVYTHAPGSVWQTTAVPMPGIGYFPVLSLALDGDGRPHLLATGSTSNQSPLLLYAYDAPQRWVSEPIAIQRYALGKLSLALDSHNRPVVLYETHNEASGGRTLWLARRGAAGWTHGLVAHALSVSGKSLALDAADRAHVVFIDDDQMSLFYTYQTDVGWQTLVDYSDGDNPSLALDESGQPHVVYVSPSARLLYLVLHSEGWYPTTVTSDVYSAAASTLLLDDAGAAHIATLEYGDTLHYATNASGYWAVTPIARQDAVAQRHALALDADDNPTLLYYQPSTAQLRLAVRNGGEWITSLVAGDVAPDLELALAMGPDGVAQIAYIDDDDDKLIVGSLEAGGWALQTLSTANHNLALVVGQDNRLHLIIIQNDRLIYWTKQGGIWQREQVSPVGVAIRSAFLALDSQGRPTVVYFAPNTDGLTVAVRQSLGNWTTTLLPYRTMTAMALGPDDAIYLLFMDERYEPGKPPWTFISLWLAEQQGGDWQDTQLYENLFNGDYPDGRLLFDADGRLHIILREPGGYLRYQRQEADGQGSGEGIEGSSRDFTSGAFALAVGSDGQPRVSQQVGGDLVLHRREIRWLDQHVLLPIVPNLGY
jgi:hypothetical protein